MFKKIINNFWAICLVMAVVGIVVVASNTAEAYPNLQNQSFLPDGLVIEGDIECAEGSSCDVGTITNPFNNGYFDNLIVNLSLQAGTAEITLATTTISATGTNPVLTVIQGGTGDILNLFDGVTEVMTVINGGNVGIGTTTPTALLSVNAPAGIDSFAIGSSTTQYFRIDSTGNVGMASDKYFQSFNSSTGLTDNLFYASTSAAMVMATDLQISGNITLDTDSQYNRLVNIPITSGLASGSSTIITFAHDNSDILTIFSESNGAGGVQNQRIGIATTSPATLLDIYSSATTTQAIDSSSASQGACLKMKDTDGGGYSYITVLNGVMTVSQTSCE